MRRALLKSGKPLADLARSMAPDDPATGGFDLKTSIIISTALSRRQKKLAKRLFPSERSSVEVYVGAGPLPQAHLQEFGTRHHGPQSFLRPAWMQDRQALLERLKQDVWAEVSKSIAHAERRAARAAAGA